MLKNEYKKKLIIYNYQFTQAINTNYTNKIIWIFTQTGTKFI